MVCVDDDVVELRMWGLWRDGEDWSGVRVFDLNRGDVYVVRIRGVGNYFGWCE